MFQNGGDLSNGRIAEGNMAANKPVPPFNGLVTYGFIIYWLLNIGIRKN